MCAAKQDWWNQLPPAMTVKRAGQELRVNVTSALEQMPHLMQKLCSLWGTGEFAPFVDQIIMDARDGKRQGLPWEAAEELLFLVQLSMAKRALIASETTGLPYHQLLSQVRAAAEATGRRGDPWADPRANRETGRVGRDRNRSRPASADSNRAGDELPWWRRLFR
jgi:hypothetical protein